MSLSSNVIEDTSEMHSASKESASEIDHPSSLQSDTPDISAETKSSCVSVIADTEPVESMPIPNLETKSTQAESKPNIDSIISTQDSSSNLSPKDTVDDLMLQILSMSSSNIVTQGTNNVQMELNALDQLKQLYQLER
jgi:hypothetical protein